ncbi:MAG TPA: hypothetical protein PLC80_01705 [Draconibacterium sp.]|nr:hypothetical protein [Draconibacterium sp.]
MDEYLDKYLELQETQKEENKGDTALRPILTKQAEPVVYNSLNLVWLDGRQQAFNYGYMTSVEFKALETGNRITATFTTHKIIITGFSLNELYLDLTNRYVSTIEQSDESYAHLIQDGTPMVTQIDVQPYH